MIKASKAWAGGLGAAIIVMMGAAAADPAEDFLYQLNYGVLEAPAELAAPKSAGPSPERMLRDVDAYFPQMEQKATVVRSARDAARERRHAVKLLCLADILNQIEGVKRTAERRADSLRASIARGRLEQARHEFSILRILQERVASLASESSQCIGEEIGVVGEATVTATIDPNIAVEDPNEMPIMRAPDEMDRMMSAPPVISSPVGQ